MFLDSLVRKNKKFVETVIKLHQAKKIPANSYVLDLDTIHDNATLIIKEASKYGMKVFAMTKQLGRNGALIETLIDAGIDSCVAVDMAGARPSYMSGFKIGHIGHLVQVPSAEALAAAKMAPEYWTVFSKEKAIEASLASVEVSREQKILVRVCEDSNTFYKGHGGGIAVDDLPDMVEFINELDQLKFVGITTFPALLFDNDKGEVLPTDNLATLKKCQRILSDMGIDNIEINAPGTTSSEVIKILADAGATQIEPGHGLTGTTPLHCVKDLPEQPAVLYLSEVSHEFEGRQYCFGGGLYIDPVFPKYDVKVLVGSDSETAFAQKVSCEIPPSNAIDYYGMLKPEKNMNIKQGDTVIFGFRVQAFVTRGYVVPVKGIQSGNPEIKGVWNIEGRRIGWPEW
ncbi:MAG: alanine racemase [Clostridiales bacterium]|nr:alanine racemase [Clostridiales bacterium]